MFIRAYLRASTKEQDANRAMELLNQFVQDKGNGKKIAKAYVENASGTKEERPKLEELLSDSHEGDILLIEKMDRLTRLPWKQWETLEQRIHGKGLRIVVMDQVMTHPALLEEQGAISPIQEALTKFMLNLGAAMARDDYETRERRRNQGINKAKAIDEELQRKGASPIKYKGRRADDERNNHIRSLLETGHSYTKIQEMLKCSRSTIARVRQMMNEDE